MASPTAPCPVPPKHSVPAAAAPAAPWAAAWRASVVAAARLDCFDASNNRQSHPNPSVFLYPWSILRGRLWFHDIFNIYVHVISYDCVHYLIGWVCFFEHQQTYAAWLQLMKWTLKVIFFVLAASVLYPTEGCYSAFILEPIVIGR